jgi:hypothetical protein
MVCDYYFWIETVIQYVDSEGQIQSYIEGTVPKHGYNKYPRDRDFEYVIGLDDEIHAYGRKIMFQNNEWYCLDVGKLRIQEICYKKKIWIFYLMNQQKRFNIFPIPQKNIVG